MLWTDSGEPLDRFGRPAGECRQGAEQADALAADLEALEERCRQLLLGREAGGRFWKHFAAIANTLRRVGDRDLYFADELEQAAERERQSG